jgi:hypothetical protein
MNKLLTLTLATLLCTPAFAQKMGGANSNAPTIKQSIAMGDNSMSLDYTAITWASGETIKAIMDKENGASMRKRVNNGAPNSPLATFKTSVDCACGDLQLAAGEYKVFYTITDECEWQINFQMKDKVQTMTLPLMDSHEENKRLLMCLYAGEKGAGVYVAFGSQLCMLNFEPVAKKGA